MVGCFESTPLMAREEEMENTRPQGLLFWSGMGGLVFFSAVATSVLFVAAFSNTSAGSFRDHVVLMPLAFVLIAPLGATVWRVGAAFGAPHAIAKTAHGSMMSSAALIGSFGFGYIWDAHSGQTHFQSAHSWVGGLALVLFIGNAISAALIFALPFASHSLRVAFKPLHVFVGGISIVITLASALMGIVSFAGRGDNASAKDLEYKFAALAMAGLLASFALVFYSSSLGKPDRASY